MKKMMQTQEEIENIRKDMVGFRYRHFKGNVYVVTDVALHSESEEPTVIYRDYNDPESVWARPLQMFTSEVDREKYPDIKQKLRFEKLVTSEPNPETTTTPAYRGKILHMLKEIERQHGVKILLAVYAGSRAYGCAMEDSDYDVRFIYIHPTQRYLALEAPAETISVKDGKYDLAGWELKRTLTYVAKSNATLWDWLQVLPSHIINVNGFGEALKEVALPYFREKPFLHIYLSLIRSYRKEGSTVKSCLGIMRVMMQAIFVMQYHAVPPVDFETLIKQTVLPGTQDAIEYEHLMELGKAGHKNDPYQPTCELIANAESRVESWIWTVAEQERKDISALDRFFADCNAEFNRYIVK